MDNKMLNLDTEMLVNYEAIKDKLFVKVRHVDLDVDDLIPANAACLETDDGFLFTYHIHLGEAYHVLVTRELLDKAYHKGIEELHADAMISHRNLFPLQIENLGKILADMGHPMDIGDSELICVTNEQRSYGAVAMFFDDILIDLYKRLGGNYYILPSSIHEILVISTSEEPEVNSLINMVQSINAGIVAPHERLSDYVYKFSPRKGLECYGEPAI